MRRVPVTIVIVAISVLSLPASAKMPGFDVSLEPAQPVAGEPTVVRVVLDHEIGLDRLDGLVGFHRSDDLDPPFNALVVSLTLVDRAAYSGTVTFPDAGEWVMVSFPDRSGWSTDELAPIYPGPIGLTVRHPDGPRSAASTSSVLAGAGIVASLLVATALRGRGAGVPGRSSR